MVRTNRIIRRTNIDKGVHKYTKKTLNGVVPNEVVLDTRHNIFVREKSFKNLGKLDYFFITYFLLLDYRFCNFKCSQLAIQIGIRIGPLWWNDYVCVCFQFREKCIKWNSQIDGIHTTYIFSNFKMAIGTRLELRILNLQ